MAWGSLESADKFDQFEKLAPPALAKILAFLSIARGPRRVKPPPPPRASRPREAAPNVSFCIHA